MPPRALRAALRRSVKNSSLESKRSSTSSSSVAPPTRSTVERTVSSRATTPAAGTPRCSNVQSLTSHGLSHDSPRPRVEGIADRDLSRLRLDESRGKTAGEVRADDGHEEHHDVYRMEARGQRSRFGRADLRSTARVQQRARAPRSLGTHRRDENSAERRDADGGAEAARELHETRRDPTARPAHDALHRDQDRIQRESHAEADEDHGGGGLREGTGRFEQREQTGSDPPRGGADERGPARPEADHRDAHEDRPRRPAEARGGHDEPSLDGKTALDALHERRNERRDREEHDADDRVESYAAAHGREAHERKVDERARRALFEEQE